MIWAAIKSDATRLWRALTRDAVAELRNEVRGTATSHRESIVDLHVKLTMLETKCAALNDRIVALEIERAAAPPAEPEPDIATSWQRARARAEHG